MGLKSNPTELIDDAPDCIEYVDESGVSASVQPAYVAPPAQPAPTKTDEPRHPTMPTSGQLNLYFTRLFGRIESVEQLELARNEAPANWIRSLAQDRLDAVEAELAERGEAAE